MIYLYSGTPGSGKSLHQAKDLYHWLQWGYTAIANFDIDVSKIPKCKGSFIYLDNDHLNPRTLERFSRVYFNDHKFREGKLRVYIDECQLLFNARDWQMNGRKEWLSFFTQHRKYGYDIFLAAQFDRMIDKQIRSLIEYEYIHRKVTNGSIVGKWLGLVTDLFVSVEVWYPLKEKISSEWFTAKKKYYSLYDTLNTFDERSDVNDTDITRHIELITSR